MVIQVCHRRAHHFRRGIAADRNTLDIPLLQKWCANLANKLVLEPCGQAANLGTFGRRAPDQACRLVLGLFEKLGNHHGASQNDTILGDKHRNIAGRVHAEEFLMTFPGKFHFREKDEVPLGKHQPRRARGAIKRMMMQEAHVVCLAASSKKWVKP